MQPPVILVIPAWDEAESIGAVLSEVPPELVGEVVVVVGSSADPTAAVAAAHGARIIAQSLHARLGNSLMLTSLRVRAAWTMVTCAARCARWTPPRVPLAEAV